MTLELLNTLGTLTTVAIVGATAIAALVQLRHLRAANQINAMLSVVTALDAEPVRAAGTLARQKLGSAMDDTSFRELIVARVRGKSQPDVEQQLSDVGHAARLVCNSYEELGILVKHHIVATDIILDRYSFVILRTWKEMQLFVGLVREASGRDDVWENFE